MKAIEAENEELKDILPKTYKRLENSTLIELLGILGSISMDIEGDAFGIIYEYFLGKYRLPNRRKMLNRRRIGERREGCKEFRLARPPLPQLP